MIYIKSIIPYECDLKLNNKVSEVTSISLEHNEKIDNDEINGNFVISGDYKTHIISVNKEKFEKIFPFSVELPSNVVLDSVKFDINDFTYEIKDDDTLNFKIETYLEFEEKSLDENREIVDANIVEEKNTTTDNNELIENEIEETIINNNINTYVTYHVYNIELDDDINTICKKYNVSKEVIDYYNKDVEFMPGNKLIIPLEKNE